MVATSTTTAGRLPEPADDRQVDDGPEGQPESERDDERHPERHVVLHDQEREDGGSDDAHVADGEVDDPGGAVDEHDPHGDHGDGSPCTTPSKTIWLLIHETASIISSSRPPGTRPAPGRLVP